MDRMGFLNNALHPVNPVNPVLIKLDFIPPPFAVFAIFCKNIFGSVPAARMTGAIDGRV